MVKNPEDYHDSDESIFYPSKIQQQDVMNLRLTCQRFCQNSSHLLLNMLRVELNQKSLQRLEGVSRHPVMRKSITAIQFNLSYYSWLLAQDIRQFARYQIASINEQNDNLSLLSMLPTAKEYPIDDDTLARSIALARIVTESWEHLVNGISTNDQDLLKYQDLLREIHMDYGRRFMEQENLRKDGNFIHLVAASISQLPNAKSFQFSDLSPHLRMTEPESYEYIDAKQGLINRTLTPHC